MSRPGTEAVLAFIIFSAGLCLSCAPAEEAAAGPGREGKDAAEAGSAVKPCPPEVRDPMPVAYSRRNLFPNPSFEQGRAPWYSLAMPEKPYWADFSLAECVAWTGRRSGLLTLTSRDYEGKARIYGIIQEVAPEELPRRLVGWHRVEDWKRGAKNQYLQAVVIVWGAANSPIDVGNIQIAYVLGGIEEPPFQIRNRRFVFTGPAEPVEGEWIRFERDLHEDFRREWGVVPQGFDKIRVLFEVRFDGRDPGGPPAGAKVYYDDLYIGP